MTSVKVPTHHPRYKLEPPKGRGENSAKPKVASRDSNARRGAQRARPNRVGIEIERVPEALPLMRKAQGLLKRASVLKTGHRKKQQEAIVHSYAAAQILQTDDEGWNAFSAEVQKRRPELGSKLRRNNVLRLAILYAHNPAEPDLARRVSLFVRALKPFFDKKMARSEIERKIKNTDGGFKGLAAAHAKKRSSTADHTPREPDTMVLIRARLTGSATNLVSSAKGTNIEMRARVVKLTKTGVELEITSVTPSTRR